MPTDSTALPALARLRVFGETTAGTGASTGTADESMDLAKAAVSDNAVA